MNIHYICKNLKNIMILTEQDIKEINKKCPYNQGIFFEPFGIPDNIKELVIYTKWESGGRPGSCWDDENTINEEYYNDRPSDAYYVFHILLEKFGIDMKDSTIEQYLDSNDNTEYGYYGDYTEDTIEWIKLDKFCEIVNRLLRENKLNRILK